MKVLQVINSLQTGGAEKLLVDSIPLYLKKGIEMDLLLLNGSDTQFKSELSNKSNCRVYSLSSSSVYNPFHVFRIIPFLKKYDIVHVHLFPSLYWVAFAKFLGSSKPILIFTEHNTSNRRMENRLFGVMDRLVYRFYDKIVTIADEVDSNIKKHLGFSEDNFRKINNGVEISQIQQAKPYPKNNFYTDDDFILIQVSSFRTQKDHETLIKALKHLGEDVKLLLVGEGELKERCQKLVKELKLEQRVKFLGTRMDVAELLKTADIVVLSSHYEGLSLSSIEGMASGKPFIASDVPGLREIVSGAGLLFPQGDAANLAHQIDMLLKDKKYYDSVVASCQQRAQEFDIELMVGKYIGLYKSYAQA